MSRLGDAAIGTSPYDVVVVGGGPAGLSAALVLGRALRRVVVVDAGSPRNAPAAHMHGFMSRDGMPPSELLAAARAELARYGVELIADRVLRIETGFTVLLGGGSVLNARHILIATGVRDELPDIPGVRERWGRDLLHCPYCHGWEVRDQPLGVLGTGAHSVVHALLVRQWSADVVFFTHTVAPNSDEFAQLAARGVQVLRGEVRQLIVQGGRLVGCDLDPAGFPIVDETGRTSISGVWAAGNVTNPRLQVISSAGAGSAAAIAVNADLVQEDVERAIRTRLQGARRS